MISYEIRSIFGEKLSNTNPYDMSDEFLNWIKFKYYPIVKWRQENRFSGKLAQYFSATSYGKWWLPITVTITDQSSLSEIIKVCLTSQQPSTYLAHRIEEEWILVDVKQAGKYIYLVISY